LSLIHPREGKLSLRHEAFIWTPGDQVFVSRSGLIGFSLRIQATGHSEKSLTHKGTALIFAYEPFELGLRVGILPVGEQAAAAKSMRATGN
jgi:hypothetical protein